MAKYIINIPLESISKIQELIVLRQYKNVPEFVSIAIENQINLEESSDSTLPNNSESISENAPIVDSSSNNLESTNINSRPLSSKFVKIPDHKIITVPLPIDGQITYGPLWGQYNKLLPIKVALRVLVNMVGNNADFIDLNIFQDNAANMARETGLKLVKYENEMGVQQGGKFSTGLPVGKNEFKTKARFKNQFIGYLTKSDCIEGALGALSFINMKRDSKGNAIIGITEPGFKFACLINPILDKNTDMFETVFSNDEIIFYLEHIKTHLVGEYDIIRDTLKNISDGLNKPDVLTTKIKEWDDSWSDDVANNMRTGIISRLFDLKLIKKIKDGLYVTYYLTEEGEQFVRN